MKSGILLRVFGNFSSFVSEKYNKCLKKAAFHDNGKHLA